jgi:hypothetical protein
MVWDRGTYRNLDKEKGVQEAIEDGRLKVWLDGEKIKGGYAFMETGERWLLVKMNDDEADNRRNPTSTETKSVKSGRTLEEIEESEKSSGN